MCVFKFELQSLLNSITCEMYVCKSMFEIGCSKAADVECVKSNGTADIIKSNWVENVCVCIFLIYNEWVFQSFTKIYVLVSSSPDAHCYPTYTHRHSDAHKHRTKKKIEKESTMPMKIVECNEKRILA